MVCLVHRQTASKLRKRNRKIALLTRLEPYCRMNFPLCYGLFLLNHILLGWMEPTSYFQCEEVIFFYWYFEYQTLIMQNEFKHPYMCRRCMSLKKCFLRKKLEWEEQRYWWAFTSSKKDRHRGREVVFPLCNIFWR